MIIILWYVERIDRHRQSYRNDTNDYWKIIDNLMMLINIPSDIAEVPAR